MPREELAKEQAYVEMLYSRLDEERLHTEQELASRLRGPAAAGRDLLERDAQVTQLRDRRAALDAAEQGLCFGRIDTDDGTRHYVGRMGLRDRTGSGDPLLLDWRAAAARPFYLATAASPQGLRRRRHLTTRSRQVVRVDDELLAGGEAGRAEAGCDQDGEAIVGEGALLAALTTGRSGRMRDVVATLQREQDEAVRSGHQGVLVIQGGPGTGKTAVALHRAAYLLYTHPEIARRGVLVVGPSPLFLGYVSDVLPGLGETRAVLSTVAELFPGVQADREEDAEVAELKGRPEMAEIVAAAVRDRQGSSTPVAVDVDGDLLTLSAEFLGEAVQAARDTRLPHNRARAGFRRLVLLELARQAGGAAEQRLREVEEGFEAELAAADKALLKELDQLPAPTDDGSAEAASGAGVDETQLARELAAHPEVRTALERLWPDLTPEHLLDDLFADPQRLAVATSALPAAEQALLREPGQGWSEADVPLLDEAAELLGADTRSSRREAERAAAEQIAYAQGVLDIAGTATIEEDDDETASARMLDARMLASRHDTVDPRTLAERAAADVTWAYGHVVVDEAQELSAMAWRTLMRRCPTRSMTVVGDLAQTHSPAGASSWEQVLGPHVGVRMRVLRLNVNYRTPAEIMDAATRVLALTRPSEPAPRSIRDGGSQPWRSPVPRSGLARLAALWAERELNGMEDGRIAVLASEQTVEEVRAAVAERVPEASYGAEVDLQRTLVVLTVTQAKGLEFDSVLIVDPAAILAGPRGANDLYVAMTRTTRGLGLLHPDPVPAAVAEVAVAEVAVAEVAVAEPGAARDESG